MMWLQRKMNRESIAKVIKSQEGHKIVSCYSQPFEFLQTYNDQGIPKCAQDNNNHIDNNVCYFSEIHESSEGFKNLLFINILYVLNGERTLDILLLRYLYSLLCR